MLFHIMINETMMRCDVLVKLCKRTRKKLGLIITCVGIGVVLTVIVPIWGWIAAAGIAIIYLGWQVMDHSHH